MANTFIFNPAYPVPIRITLEYLQGAFDCWYALQGRNKKIPDYLWQLVLKVLPYYRKNKILGATHLTYPILNKHVDRNRKPNMGSFNPLVASSNLARPI
jgi:hypothetical protein